MEFAALFSFTDLIADTWKRSHSGELETGVEGGWALRAEELDPAADTTEILETCAT